MKRNAAKYKKARWCPAAVLGACVAAIAAPAAETNAPPEAPFNPQETFEGGKESYNNWLELSAGGFFVDGRESQFQQRARATTSAFGGIEDFHYQTDVAKGTTFMVDGRALFDLEDYAVKLGIARENLGYLRFSYREFRTWYNGDGGYYPAASVYYPLANEALSIDRGEASIEGGLTLKNLPALTFRYAHQFRDGEKSSTVWGTTHPGGGPARGLSPSFRDIHESSDIFEIGLAHRIKKTDLGLGVRYETGELNETLKIRQSPGEPVDRRLTDRQDTKYDSFNAYAFSETWLKNNLMFSAGAAYSDVDSTLSGSRIYGSDFDVGYVPNALNGAGYVDLNGGSRLREYVLNLNLLAVPLRNLTVVPSVRVQKEDIDADFTGTETFAASAPLAFSGNSDRDLLDVRERMDIRFTGITNWVFHARGEWTQGQGNTEENGGFRPIGAIGIPPIQRRTEDDRFFQKYSVGARWYPARAITLDAGAYYKINRYDYDHEFDSTPNNSANRYPAYFVMQEFETWDPHIGVTLRPWKNVVVVGRYEFQTSTIHTRPDQASGLAEVESSEMTSHIASGHVSWVPWSRLNLQAGVSYVVSDTRTPASDITAAILDAQNNYLTLNVNAGFVIDDRTDLNLGYFYYRADNFRDNSPDGVPYGAGAEEHGVTVSVVRRLSERLRVRVRYGFVHYDDETFGGNRNFEAHGILTSLQYRF